MSDEKHEEPEPYADDAVCSNCELPRRQHTVDVPPTPIKDHTTIYSCPNESGTKFEPILCGETAKPEPRDPIQECKNKIMGYMNHTGGGIGQTAHVIAAAGAVIIDVIITECTELCHMIEGIPHGVPLEDPSAMKEKDLPSRKVAPKMEKDEKYCERVEQALGIAVERLMAYEAPIRLASRQDPPSITEVKSNLFLEVNNRNNEITVEMTTRISDTPPTT